MGRPAGGHLPPETVQEALALARQGVSAREIAVRLGVSAPTAARWLKRALAAPQSPSAPGAPLSSDDLAELDVQLTKAKAELEQLQDPRLRQQYHRLVADLLGRRAKMRPPTPPDPNEEPDMRAAGRRTADLLESMLYKLMAGELAKETKT
jgi:transposase-like protein